MKSKGLTPLEHDRLVREEALKLVLAGYEVDARIEGWFVPPKPIFGYRPDIFAKRGGSTVVVEVTKGAGDWPKISALERFAHENPKVDVRVIPGGLVDPANAASTKQRFLIALAKMLGVNPTERSVLSGALLCDPWLLDEIVGTVLNGSNKIKLQFETFNRLMVNCRRPVASRHFYSHFFSDVSTIDKFETAIEKYRVVAMFLYGNFKFSYRKLATCSEPYFVKLMSQVEPKKSEEFERRPLFHEIAPIAKPDLHLLGYISGNQVRDLLGAEVFLDQVLKNFRTRKTLLKNIGEARLHRIYDTVTKYIPTFSTTEGFASKKSIDEALSKLRSELGPMLERQELAKETGRKNTQRYLSLPYLDVYVATSMREEKDFVDQQKFIYEVFSSKLIKALNLRYFDPTLSYVDDRVTKGLVECLMLQRAAVTIFNAGDSDTMGKDSELAATLAQGKPVIVYVPTGTPKLDSRAEQFRVSHPLGLQIDHRTGVAHGIIVVRSAPQCAKVLKSVLLGESVSTIRHEGGIYHLEDQETESVIRVVSDNSLVTHAFWTFFNADGKED